MEPSRRDFLGSTATSLAAGALGTPRLVGEPAPEHHRPRARALIWLFMSGGPSQLETFDPKPTLDARHGEDLPDSVRRGQRLTAMSANQAHLPLARSVFRFAQHGRCGAWVSELLPWTARIVDDLCIVRSVHTQAINHDPAITFVQTGAELAGRPSIGAWLDYGLGTRNPDLPSYCVLVTQGKGGQPIYSRLWGSGFLPSRHQGVQLRGGADPVLYLDDPPGVDRDRRRRLLDTARALQQHEFGLDADPAIAERIAQQELAYRMQRSVPEVADLASEPESTFSLYGDDARRPGTFAANCLLARRLVERGVRCVQLFHRGWDQHGDLPAGIRTQCQETDRASAALVLDLKRRGLLDDTLVVWGGEFGRTAYCQGRLTGTAYGRDHHPRCFTVWLAGGGVRTGHVHGETCEFGYDVVRDPVHVHDLQATVLHLLGIDHERLTFLFQGRRFRLTDVHGEVVRPLLA
ncbi:MAG: DUF1501 domain-containing protein [Planctomycetes bacterium]|nr:DUF1501 domain-containing protein [Planctomycetota bacterium]